MKNSGIVDLPLHGGKCPPWLFDLMKNLAGKVSELIVDEYGNEEFLRKVSDPYWFQSFGCALGFDWHSSGLTTTTTGALKEALKNNNLGLSLGIGCAGGKGNASKKTPDEIVSLGDRMLIKEKTKQDYVRSSRLSAKVDNSLLQDGFSLYHHSFFFTKKSWIVVQQGMNEKFARRYHWTSENLKSFVNEPHLAIVSDKLTNPLNLTARESEDTRKTSLDLIKENPVHLTKYLKVKTNETAVCSGCFGQKKLSDFFKKPATIGFDMPKGHFPKISFELKQLIDVYETKPDNYEEMILTRGMGAKNIRALAMISHLVYGTTLSWKDPVKYSFAHGGKDGWPEPVDRERYRASIDFLKQAIKDSRIGNKERAISLKRLDKFYSSMQG